MRIFGRYHFREIRFHLLMVCFFLLVSFFFCLPLLKNLHQSCSGDWDYFATLYEVPSITLYEYKQFPLWNPYCGGGISLIGNPQAGFVSITFLLTSLFGVFAGLKLSVWLHTFIGLWGMWLISGELGVRGPARFLPPFIFMFSAPWPFHLAEGHIVWLPAAFLPLLMLSFLKGMESRRWLYGGVILEAAMIYEGGTYVLAYSVLFLAVFALCRAIEMRSMKPLVTIVVINFLAFFIAAPKLLPLLDLMGNHPRTMNVGGAVSWDDLLAMFLERDNSRGTIHLEFSAYVGLPVVVLYLFAVATLRKYKALIASSLFMLLLVIGNFAPFAPWTLFHRLPLFNNFQIPARSVIIFCFTVALLVGLYLTRLTQGSKWAPFLVGLMVLYIGTDLYLFGRSIFPQASIPAQVTVFRFSGLATLRRPATLYRVPPADSSRIFHSVTSFHEPFSQISIPDMERFRHGAWSDQYLPLLHNEGVTDAYEPIPFGHFALPSSDPGYRGEYHLQEKGDVTMLHWSPNQLSFRVCLPRDDRLIINQNYGPGWQSSAGTIEDDKGLLAVDLKRGAYEVTIRYLPHFFAVGLLISIVTVGVMAICWRRSGMG